MIQRIKYLEELLIVNFGVSKVYEYANIFILTA